MRRVLKPEKKLFVVVRSTDCEEVSWPDSEYDSKTGLTYVTYTHPQTKAQTRTARYFHTEKSIIDHMKSAGFVIENVESYTEQLYVDFERTIKASELDHLIEVVGSVRG